MTAEPLAYELSASSDGTLAHEHLDGGEQAFAELYRRYYPRLVRLCARRTGDPHLAEDIAQETLVRALRYLGGFDKSRPMWPWLKTIATRIAYQNAQRAQLERCSDLAHEDPDLYAVESPCRQIDDRMVLSAALDRVPARQRAALIMRYVDDWSTAESARLAGMTVPAFEQLLFRARRRLSAEYHRVTDARRAGLAGLPAAVALLRRLRVALRARVEPLGGAGVAGSGLMGFATMGLTVIAMTAPPLGGAGSGATAARLGASDRAAVERFVAMERVGDPGGRGAATPTAASNPTSTEDTAAAPGAAPAYVVEHSYGPARARSRVNEQPLGGGRTFDVEIRVQTPVGEAGLGIGLTRPDRPLVDCHNTDCEVRGLDELPAR